MDSLFDDGYARSSVRSRLAMRVYTSRLLGSSDELVLHGGGNTSVKIDDTLYVKGSGWDLATIEEAGFSPVDLETLKAMATRETLSDTQMVKEQRAALHDDTAPNPSIEAILHAIIPFDYVDHTHADAIVTISSTPDGKAYLEEIYGDTVLIVDYVMPGFLLAKHIFEQTRDIDWQRLEGIILLNHGLFTFDHDAKKSYEKTIALVDKAEKFLDETTLLFTMCVPGTLSPVVLERLRERVSELRGCEIVLKTIDTIDACTLSKLPALEDIVHHGNLTPEHVIRTKPFPAIIADDADRGIDDFVEAYKRYFDEHASAEHIMLDIAPRYAIIKEVGAVVFGKDEKEATIIKDIVEHTIRAILQAEMLGGWQSLKPKDIFAMEYWELEQAKLKAATK